MSNPPVTSPPAAITLEGVCKRFGTASALALDQINATVAAGQLTGLVGPDGAGKTTLIRMIAGLMHPTEGKIEVFGSDTRKPTPEFLDMISYMPQRFGLYEDLTVIENLTLYADLKDVSGEEGKQSFDRLLEFTDLKRFSDRLAGALSGGMKQKLGLACSLIKKPKLLLLDEPSVGVDPVSRRELWTLVKDLIDGDMAVIWSTAYLDEAERCDTVLLLNEGKLLFEGPPAEMTQRIEGRAFQVQGFQKNRRQVLTELLGRDEVIDGVIQGQSIRLVLRQDASTEALSGSLPEGSQLVSVPPRFEDAFVDALGGGPDGASALAGLLKPIETEKDQHGGQKPVVEAIHLTKQYGSFKAADDITFSIQPGEIFGLLGPNGAGKSTTFKMMCGLAKPTHGDAKVTGLSLLSASSQARSNIGYMAQKFSLYGNLSVLQNLRFFSGVYDLGGKAQAETVDRMVSTFDLQPYLNSKAEGLPLGFKQRLALACAVMHNPAVLFLDEPTSGVDPVTRREFWMHINGLVQKGVTVMVTTHFMDEAEYCDRIGLVYRGKIIAMGDPDSLKAQTRSDQNPDHTMEDAFIALIEQYDHTTDVQVPQEAAR